MHTRFSNTDELMYEFFDANARAINALTIKDVIFGEIEDSVSKVDDIEDLLSIKQVEFKVLSAEDVLGKAAELRTLVDRLKQRTGCVARQRAARPAWSNWPRSPATSAKTRWCRTRWSSATMPIWTSHFGGLYVFIDEKMTTVIATRMRRASGARGRGRCRYLSINDSDAVFKFLARTGRLDAAARVVARAVRLSGASRRNGDPRPDAAGGAEDATSTRLTTSGCRHGCTAMPT